MSYIKKALTNSEKLIQLFRIHVIEYLSPTLALLVGISIMKPAKEFGVLLLIIGSYRIAQIFFIEMGITSTRVISKRGIVARSTDEIQNYKIETVSLKQGILGRILGFGTVLITGSGSTKLELKNLSAPLNVKSFIEETIGSKDAS